MGDLTTHFSRWEFRSRDFAFSAEAEANLPKTAGMLEALRAALSAELGRDCPVKVLSGYRSPAHNAAVGGAPKSYHLRGMAADVTCAFASPALVQRIARRLQARGLIGGLGVYAGFSHVDWGPRRSWTQKSWAARAGAV